MTKIIGLQYIALRHAGGQAGAWPHAGHIPNDTGNFGKIGIAGKLAHQRNTGATGGGHRTRSRPTGANNHTGGGQFVFGLNNAIGWFAIWRLAQDGQIVAQGIGQTGGWGDGIPRHKVNTTINCTQRARRIAIHHN